MALYNLRPQPRTEIESSLTIAISIVVGFQNCEGLRRL
ncbi:unnamed protein product, partial [Vitis vinifera]|uniref:Uncharacterized protein n=1 Tax=Vitis vinifera TaxID=29760 RepID=D7TKN8_VITVI